MDAAIRTYGVGHPYLWRRPSLPIDAAIPTHGGGHPYLWRRPSLPIEAAIRTYGGGHPYLRRQPSVPISLYILYILIFCGINYRIKIFFKTEVVSGAPLGIPRLISSATFI
jgi:hypothetical protein